MNDRRYRFLDDPRRNEAACYIGRIEASSKGSWIFSDEYGSQSFAPEGAWTFESGMLCCIYFPFLQPTPLRLRSESFDIQALENLAEKCKRRRFFERTPLSPWRGTSLWPEPSLLESENREANGKLVHVRGKIEASRVLTAPLRKTSCIAYTTLLKQNFEGPILRESELISRFQLRLINDRLVDIDARFALADLDFDRRESSSLFHRFFESPSFLDWALKHAVQTKEGWDSFRCEEAALEVGEEISVLGRLHWEASTVDDDELSFRDQDHRRGKPVLSGTLLEPLLIHDWFGK